MRLTYTDVIPPAYGLGDSLQGARSYDPNLGNWTAPDAYQGDIGDPTSMMPYMWDGNNPIIYSDPSGYCTNADGTSDGKSTLCTITTEHVRCSDCHERAGKYASKAQAELDDIDGTMKAGGVGLVLTDMAGMEGRASLAAGAEARSSLLLDASEVAYQAAQRARLFKVPLKHLSGAGGRWAKFAQGVDPQSLIEEALKSPEARFLPNANGGFQIVTPIGGTVCSKGRPVYALSLLSKVTLLLLFR